MGGSIGREAVLGGAVLGGAVLGGRRYWEEGGIGRKAVLGGTTVLLLSKVVKETSQCLNTPTLCPLYFIIG